MARKTLGGRIAELREYFDLTQTQFAKEWGVSQGFLSDVEADKKSIGYELMEKLVTWFGANANWVCTGKEPMLLDQLKSQHEPIRDIPEENQRCQKGAYNLTVDQVRLLSAMKTLNETSRMAILAQVEQEYMHQRAKEFPDCTLDKN